MALHNGGEPETAGTLFCGSAAGTRRGGGRLVPLRHCAAAAAAKTEAQSLGLDDDGNDDGDDGDNDDGNDGENDDDSTTATTATTTTTIAKLLPLHRLWP